jgi:hypothetical protein
MQKYTKENPPSCNLQQNIQGLGWHFPCSYHDLPSRGEAKLQYPENPGLILPVQ